MAGWGPFWEQALGDRTFGGSTIPGNQRSPVDRTPLEFLGEEYPSFSVVQHSAESIALNVQVHGICKTWA